ncbi:MAG: NAD(P)H-binding protein [Bacteroidota bacterium]
MTLDPRPSTKPTVAIAGATGFVGTCLRDALQDEAHLVGLTRSATRATNADPSDPTEWRKCDLFSLLQLERGLEGVDYAIYLVHSMLPSSRLTQGSFEDLDLILADNFARAAEKAGVKQILYLGGLLPRDGDLSLHLQSRYEVEQTLGARSVPLTALRAGIVVGPGGSSLRILVNLVRRLPAMLLPTWTRSLTHPIAIADVIRAFRWCLGNAEAYGETYDIGGPEIMTYREMMATASEVAEARTLMLDVPAFSPHLSKLWVSVFGGASRELVDPLVDSLKHDLVARDNPLLRHLMDGATPYREALDLALTEDGRMVPNPRKKLRKKDDSVIREARLVRSVQRMPLPPGRSARWVAEEYMRWLPTFVRPVLRVTMDADRVCRFYLRPIPEPLLELDFSPERSWPDRQLFYVTGGLLTHEFQQYAGRLEFREMLCGTTILAAIHDFSPRLPWYVYNVTQALAHLVVMHGFRVHLKRLSGVATPAESAVDELMLAAA